MSPNKRIFLNIVATYSRSLFALACGLFCGRWTLMALGEVDYGLYGVVGGLTAFISFFFNIISGAIGRFYALALGHAQLQADSRKGLEECRQWFSLAVSIHVVFPVLVFAFGYPLGIWAIEDYLSIPASRVADCVWVWRFTCLSCLLGMVTIPYNAMYFAKQFIAELTIYQFTTTTLNLLFLYYMVTHPGVWLSKYALWTCALTIIPQVLIAVRAVFLFPECRFRLSYAWNWHMYREMLSYSGWNILGSLGYMLKNQGVAVLVNKYYGPMANAAMSIASTVSAQTQALSTSIQGAFTPVITTAVGAGKFQLVRELAFRFCKLDMLFSLIFMIPLALELPYVMELWLKNPPQYATGLCLLMLLMAFIDKNTLGHGVAVMAKGEIRNYQLVLGGLNLLALPFAWLFCRAGYNVYFVNIGVLLAWILLVYGRLLFAQKLLSMSIAYWARHIMTPVLGVLFASAAVARLTVYFLQPSFMRLVLTTVLAESVLLPLSWLFVLDKTERQFVVLRVKRIFNHG